MANSRVKCRRITTEYITDNTKKITLPRHLTNFKSADLRYLKEISTWHDHKKVNVPALFAFTRGKDGELNHAQVIRLNPLTGDKDYQSKIIKQTYGSPNGCMVNLNTKSNHDTTFLTEGVETGLSLLEVEKEAQIKTVLGKENFKNVDLSNLSEHIVLCVDNDGKKTFDDLVIVKSVLRLMEAGKSVSLMCPIQEGHDFDDVLKKEGKGVLQQYMADLVDVKSLFNSVKSNQELQNHKNHEELLLIKNQMLKAAILNKTIGVISQEKSDAKSVVVSKFETRNPNELLKNNRLSSQALPTTTNNNKTLEIER